jgi:glyoxylase-like metal-dependent hydrolase (beta-lactamase superfamily II)
MQAATEKHTNLDMFTVAPQVFGMKDTFVNIYMIASKRAPDEWVLVDAGLKWSCKKIKKMAAMIFGKDSKPQCIILTHGHFDHVGSVQALAEDWDVPVFAHFLERPYLTGRSNYPPPDSTVGGGMMASMAFMYPKKPIDITHRLNLLPENGLVPNLPDWRYIHTPGHAPGHISLYREEDGVLIAGDAFVTTNQESVLSVMTQKRELNGPPKYFTTDWDAAFRSVKILADLEPSVVATGHGKPMSGPTMLDDLHSLVDNFDKKAKPSQGRYVNEAALTNEDGVVYIPDAESMPAKQIAAFALVGVLIASTFFVLKGKNRS